LKAETSFLDVSGLPVHHRPRQWAAVWSRELPDWKEQLAGVIENFSSHREHLLFFRADDVGAGGRAFEVLCELFRHHGVPLNMAVVPAWLSRTRIDQLFGTTPPGEPYWSWHQHGWRHVNWQRKGKKSEFGQERPFEKQWKDIWKRKKKMVSVFGDRFTPVFTPPWNRLSAATVKILHELGFQAASLTDPFPKSCKTPHHLKNFRVRLDLHTRKAKDGAADYRTLLDEISALADKREPWGMMIHHQKMTRFAFEFLHQLLYLFREKSGVRFLKFEDMLNKT
jgi:hypothetical protein